MNRIHNFGAGPAALPEEVLLQAQQELLNWQNRGYSIMEVSHRSEMFAEIVNESEANLRRLLNIPANYQVLFLGGGARMQFAAIPMNILADHKSIDVIVTGYWSKLAAIEAQKYCQVNIAATSEPQQYKSIPDPNTWQLTHDSAYVYYTANETIEGVEFHDIPQVSTAPLVSDMTSNILAYPIDVSRYGLIFASCQKNIGIAGLTLVIVRDDLIQKPMSITPLAYHYKSQAACQSLLTTPPTFAWYMTNLMLRWLLEQGGLNAMAEINKRKAQRLYHIIDQYDCYQNEIDARYRSRMNVTFSLKNKLLEEQFLAQAEQQQLYFLQGHSVKGGIRASLYNGVSEKAVDCLADFMTDFASKSLRTQ